MDKEKFIDHFKLALVYLNEVTSWLCFNKLSNNYSFLLDVNGSVCEEHTDEENKFITTCKQLKDQHITFGQTADLLYNNSKCVKWADMEVYSATEDLTLVRIWFSPKFVDENEVYYLERGTGPFKTVVAEPPHNLKVMIGDKFDVNWLRPKFF